MFVEGPRDFLGFWYLPPFDYPCHLNSGVFPPGITTLAISLQNDSEEHKKKTLSLFHLDFIPHDNLTDEAIFVSFFFIYFPYDPF